MSEKRADPELSVEADLTETLACALSIDETETRKDKIEGENESVSIEATSHEVKDKSSVKKAGSFNKLPQELVAEVASKLNYVDIWNLMESSKRIYKIIKGYSLDKVKINYLRIEANEVYEIKSFNASFLDNDGRRKIYNVTGNLAIVEKLLKKSSSIGLLQIIDVKFTSEVFQVFNKCEVDIEGCVAYGGRIYLSADEFVLFCQKFKKTSFYIVELRNDLWTDQALCKLMPHMTFVREKAEEYINAMNVTDKTLMALVREKTLQKDFIIPRVRNSFTALGIANLLQKLLDGEMYDVSWDLGVLRGNQAAAVKHYIYPKIGRNYLLFEMLQWKQDGLNLYQLSSCYGGFIKFSVQS